MGTGEQSAPCNTCGGDGRVRKSKRIRWACAARGVALPPVCSRCNVPQAASRVFGGTPLQLLA